MLGVVHAHVLTDKKALHVKALSEFVDAFGKTRRAGEEWLVTIDDAPTHIPDVYEKVVGEVQITTLTSRQYAVIRDPVDANGVQRFGRKELRKGECSFFLKPGERLEQGIQNVIVLGEEEVIIIIISFVCLKEYSTFFLFISYFLESNFIFFSIVFETLIVISIICRLCC